MNSHDLAKYIEAHEGITKPWLLIQLRLKKIQENRDKMSEQEYLTHIESLHQDLMKLGEWWVGIEDEVFQ
ncbi:conserved hypothetical protein [Rippkaea orientalis PCC 8801]|uniref:Uncharacterized protein n=1 Tax=Rippkaea orientalis (strain PCC 8801 / RF-1) TaxID=41431 RepID=B7K666_RIPO1|nr:hypothetical protein [Rippkaea orientalis]ACK68119.1 conserved hypothetical protein [Rippkaea orientalis PCC 8801]